MRNAVIVQPNLVQIQNGDIPQPGSGDVLIRVKASGICGTDLHIYRGEYLGSYPIVPGHEFAGLVEAVGSETLRIKVGDRVAIEPNIACDNCPDCLNNRQNFCQNWQAVGVTRPGGMSEYVLAPEKAVFSIGDLPYEVGAFMEPLSCVLHGVQRAQISLADRVAVLGAGPIGAMLLQAVRLQGAAQVTVLENNPTRAEFIATLGPDRVIRQVEDLPTNGFDVLIDATGVPALMSQSLQFVRPGGTVLLFGVPPSGSTLQLDAFQIFRKGLKILSSYTSVRNSLQAVELLQSGGIQVAPLISHRLALAEFEKGLQALDARQAGVKKVMIFPET
jgi:2-desacetyl-2-hydroxyethyl bacteriochlorophyllide A dehydrogenase